jgi:hypothetical protein
MRVDTRSIAVGVVVAGAALLAACGECGGSTPGAGGSHVGSDVGDGQRRPGTPPPSAPTGAPPPGASTELIAALARAELSLEPPSGFEVLPVGQNARWAYQYALKAKDAKLEVRYAAYPATDDHESLFAATVVRLDREGQLRGIGTFPYDSVREEFNANWGGALSFDVHPEFADGKYAKGLAIFIHRDGVGDGMFVGLFDELSGKVEWEWDRAFHSLRFVEPVGKPPSIEAGALAGTIWSCGEEGLVQMRFLETVWTVVHVSAAHAVMGQIVPYETAYHELEYQDASHFLATVFRVDNLEQGDRTPADPKPVRYSFERDGKRLTVEQVGGQTGWSCELLGEE